MGITAAEQLRREGRREGRVEGKAEAIITVLESRFGSVPASIKKSVAASTNWTELDALTALAATCNTLDEFKRGMKR